MCIYFLSISSTFNSLWQKALEMFLRHCLPDCNPNILTNLLLSGPGHSGWQEGRCLRSPEVKMEFTKRVKAWFKVRAKTAESRI